MEFTHKNHYKFGWDDKTYNFEDKTTGKFWTEYSKAEYDPGPESFRAESTRAAKLIAESAQKPLAVMFSGGLDSEVVVRSLMEAQVDFTIIISKYNYRNHTHINEYDTIYASEFAKNNKLKVKTIDIDIVDFLVNKFPPLAEKYHCDSHTWLLHTYVIGQFPDYHVICGGGDLQLQKKTFYDELNPPAWKIRQLPKGIAITEKSHIVASYNWAIDTGTNTSLRFFRHTAELMLSWLRDSSVEHFVKYNLSLSSYIRQNVSQMHYMHLKPWVMHKYWPDMTPRVKYHGFELIPSWLYVPQEKNTLYNDPQYDTIKEAFAYANQFKSQYYTIDLDDLKKMLIP